jgi:dienelactone hydrolase
MSSIACCQGFEDSGTPTGKEIEIDGITCYLAPGTKDTRVAIVITTDIFGFQPPNPRLIADGFSECFGCNVYIPDLFNGAQADLAMQDHMRIATDANSSFFSRGYRFFGVVSIILPFLIRNSLASSVSRTTKVIAHLKANGVEQVFVQGYCWGGKVGLFVD